MRNPSVIVPEPAWGRRLAGLAAAVVAIHSWLPLLVVAVVMAATAWAGEAPSGPSGTPPSVGTRIGITVFCVAALLPFVGVGVLVSRRHTAAQVTGWIFAVLIAFGGYVVLAG